MNTHKTCRACKGAGGQDVDHWTRNPELESFDTCGECGGHGRIRFAPMDALELLAKARKRRLTSRLPELCGYEYATLRANAMRPVKLPHDHWGDPLFRMAQRDCDIAIKTFQPLNALFDQMFRRAA